MADCQNNVHFYCFYFFKVTHNKHRKAIRWKSEPFWHQSFYQTEDGVYANDWNKSKNIPSTHDSRGNQDIFKTWWRQMIRAPSSFYRWKFASKWCMDKFKYLTQFQTTRSPLVQILFFFVLEGPYASTHVHHHNETKCDTLIVRCNNTERANTPFTSIFIHFQK